MLFDLIPVVQEILKKAQEEQKTLQEQSLQYDALDRLIQACESSVEVALNGVHYDLDEDHLEAFEKLLCLNQVTEYEMAKFLMDKKLGLPHDQISISFDYQDEGEIFMPIILTIQSLKNDLIFAMPWTLWEERFSYPLDTLLDASPVGNVISLKKNIHSVIDDYHEGTILDYTMTATLRGTPSGVYSPPYIESDGEKDPTAAFNFYTSSNLQESSFLREDLNENQRALLELKESMWQHINYNAMRILLKFLYFIPRNIK